MNPYNVLYPKNHKLRYENICGPFHDHNIIYTVPLDQGYGSTIISLIPDGIYYKFVGDSYISIFDP